MIPKVVEVKPLEGYRLWLRFNDVSALMKPDPLMLAGTDPASAQL